jgi:predicted molibdopterin-dependent oxidoreductase YjgC
MKLGLMDEALGGIEGAIAAARSGRLKAGVIIYLKPLVPRPDDAHGEAAVAQLIESLEYSVLLAAHRADWHAAASVVLPVTAWSEEEGTYTNYQGRVQLAMRAIAPGGDVLPIWQVLTMLLEAGDGEASGSSPAEIFSALAESVPAYRGIEYGKTALPGVIMES